MTERILSETSDNGQQPEAESVIANRLPREVETPADPFDLDRLRLSQDYGASVGVKKAILMVPCRKPNRHEFIRVRPGADWKIETAVFEDKLSRGDVYLVDPSLLGALLGETTPTILYLTINRQGDVFLWPVKLPGEDGRTNPWNESAVQAALRAQGCWISVRSNQRAGMYDVFEAEGEIGKPEWPDLTFKEILRLAFKNRLIQDADHPVLKNLRGES